MNCRSLAALVVALGVAAAMPQDLAGQVDETFGGSSGSSPSQDASGSEGQRAATQGPADDCECVPYHLCPVERIAKASCDQVDNCITPDSQCENDLEECCRPSEMIDVPARRDGNGAGVSEDGEGGGHGDGHGGGYQGTGGSDHGGQSIGCGVRNPDGVPFRLDEGAQGDARYGEFPWMAAILHEEAREDGTDEKLKVYKCGGSLIHPQVVLTAAHCVYKTPTELKVRVGEWDTQRRSEPLPHQDRNVGKIIMHPDFRNTTLYNDFALLVLDTPVELTETVQPVCLPPPGTSVEQGRCVASGWGKDVFGKEGRYQTILKKIEVPPVPRPECVERLRKSRLGKHFQLHESFICAGGEVGADTCQGDGGGPLVCPIAGHPKTYQQMGIVAWGIGCGGETPAAYANVAYGRSWIDSQMGALGFGISTYTHH